MVLHLLEQGIMHSVCVCVCARARARVCIVHTGYTLWLVCTVESQLLEHQSIIWNVQNGAF